MSESTGIAEYEGRIAAALDRIAVAADRLVRPAAPDDASLAALREALEAERATSAQLAERLGAVKAAREGLKETVAAQAAEIEALRGQLAEFEAGQSAMADLQAARARDAAEISAVLAALAPLVEEAEHA